VVPRKAILMGWKHTLENIQESTRRFEKEAMEIPFLMWVPIWMTLKVSEVWASHKLKKKPEPKT